jgi:hypothetical protein
MNILLALRLPSFIFKSTYKELFNIDEYGEITYNQDECLLQLEGNTYRVYRDDEGDIKLDLGGDHIIGLHYDFMEETVLLEE